MQENAGLEVPGNFPPKSCVRVLVVLEALALLAFFPSTVILIASTVLGATVIKCTQKQLSCILRSSCIYKRLFVFHQGSFQTKMSNRKIRHAIRTILASVARDPYQTHASPPTALPKPPSAKQRVRHSLHEDLLTTDRIMLRWAVSVAGGVPVDVWDDTLVAKPPPLPDDVAVLVDQAVMKAPRPYGGRHGLLHAWYRTPEPVEVIGRRFNCRGSDLRVELSAALAHMKSQLLQTGSHWLWGAIAGA